MAKNKHLLGYIILAIFVIIVLAYYLYSHDVFSSAKIQYHTTESHTESWTCEKISEIKSSTEQYSYNLQEGWIAWWTPDGYLRFMTSNDSVPKVLCSPNPKEECHPVYNVSRGMKEKLCCIDHVIATPDSIAFILFYPSTPEFSEMNINPYRLITFPSLNVVNVSSFCDISATNFVYSDVERQLTPYKDSPWGQYSFVAICTEIYNTKGTKISDSGVISLNLYGTDYSFEVGIITSDNFYNSYYKKALRRIFDLFLSHLGTTSAQFDRAFDQFKKDIQYLSEFDKEWGGIDSVTYPVWEAAIDVDHALFDAKEAINQLSIESSIESSEHSSVSTTTKDESEDAEDALVDLLLLDLL